MERLLLLFSALMLSISALWAHDVEIDGIYYNLDETNKTAEVTYRGIYDMEYNEYSGSVTIPSSVTYNSNIYSVSSIGYTAFSGCSELTEVTIPSSVTYIGEFVFYDCRNLTEILVSSSNEKFSSENGVLFDKDKTILIIYPARKNDKSFTIPNSVTSIGDYAFINCSSLTSVIIPNSVTSIGNSAFWHCTELTSVTIPNSVTSIGNSAFTGCSGLISVIIDENVEEIGKNIFSACSSLEEIIVSSNNEKFSSENGALFNKDKTILIKYPEGKNDKSFSIPDSVTSIGDDAFWGCNGLTSVTIPNSVTSIGDGAFSGCSGLTSVAIPNSVTSIGSSVFLGCSGLTSVAIPNSVTYIGNSAFSGCSGLTSVAIPNSVTSIGESAFGGCSALTEVTIPNSITSIDFGTFSNCSGLTEITIPNSVTSIGKYAFYDTGIYNNESNWDNGVLYIDNCLIEAKNDLVNGSYIIIEGTRLIADKAFSYCRELTSITIPNSIISIGSSAFSGCQNLKTVYNYSLLEIVKGSSDNGYVAYYAEEVINASVIGDLIVDDHGVIIKYIGDANIEEIIIPEYIEGIDEGVFSECSKIRKVISYPTKVPSAYNNSFANYNAYLYVSCDVFEDYDLDYVFGSFKYIKCIAAEEVEGSEKVEIEVDSNNNATIIWPSTGNASSYELVISKNGEVFCTLLFNENGQLTSIDFANRSASVGFQFTVTGLDGASKYSYSIVAKDEKGNELESYNGTFTTNGYSEETAILETLADANITVSGSLITCPDAEFTIYNTLGQDVTAYNGSLQPGVYVVSIAEDVVKVMMK